MFLDRIQIFPHMVSVNVFIIICNMSSTHTSFTVLNDKQATELRMSACV